MANDPWRVLVAMGAAADGIPTIIIGMPEQGWEYCQKGKTHTVDMVPAGVPARVVIFGGKDHAELTEWLKAHNSTVAEPDGDLPVLGQDTNFKPS